jgi:3-oxosteroid 1-dehydrogenase
MSGAAHSTDVVIVGSGGGALCAAITARSHGLDVLVVEKADVLGGSTAMSGGGIWIPDNPLMAREGIPDSEEDALAYFESVVGDVGLASSLERRRAYVANGTKMVAFFESLGMRFRRTEGWCDYYSSNPGAHVRSRGVEAVPFDLNRLGSWAQRVRPGMTAGLGFVASSTEFLWMSSYNRSVKGFLTSARVAARTAGGRARRAHLVANGTALIAWLLALALERDVTIWTEASLEDLVVRDGRVVGAMVRRGDGITEVTARQAVLLAAGGFSRNGKMRMQFGNAQATDGSWSRANPGDTGEVLQIAMSHGAATALLDEAIWNPAPMMPDGSPPPFPGTSMAALTSRTRYRPGTIMVDASGSRFVNESSSYVELGQRMFQRNMTVRAIPTWLIFDERFRRRNLFGRVPSVLPEKWIDAAFVLRDQTLKGLARQCGIDGEGLEATVARFNVQAGRGVDDDFHRGETAYERFFGDALLGPNNCLAPVTVPPFYALAYFPTDVGTTGGVLTDEHGCVLDGSGEPIGGLYATGNVSATVMGRAYLGAGASIGHTMTFGYIAMNHVAQVAKVA